MFCHASPTEPAPGSSGPARHAISPRDRTDDGNPIYPALIEAMFDWLEEYYVQVVRTSGAESLALEEHAGILSAIWQGDPEMAMSAMHDHLS